MIARSTHARDDMTYKYVLLYPQRKQLCDNILPKAIHTTYIIIFITVFEFLDIDVLCIAVWKMEYFAICSPRCESRRFYEWQLYKIGVTYFIQWLQWFCNSLLGINSNLPENKDNVLLIAIKMMTRFLYWTVFLILQIK